MWMTFFIVILVAIDQFLKYVASMYIKPVQSITVIPNFLEVTYLENKGAAFGMFPNHRWFFILFAIVMIIVFIYWIAYKKVKDKLFIISSTLIISGGIGNIIDRLLFGYVVDYIRFSFFLPVCNFADYCITVGTIILIIYFLFFCNDTNVVLNEKER